MRPAVVLFALAGLTGPAREGRCEAPAAEAAPTEADVQALREAEALEAALELAKRVVALREAEHGPVHTAVADAVEVLADVLFQDAGEEAEAEPHYRRVLKIREQALGPDHPDLARTLDDLAHVLVDLGDHASARPLYERSLAIREQALGADHPDVAASLNDLAILLHDLGDYAAARPLYERSLAIWEEALGPDHPRVAISLNNLANLASDVGDFAVARRLYERSLAIREQAFGPDHPSVAASLDNLALLLHDLGDYTAARPLYERSLGIRERTLGPEHPDVASSLHNLALLSKDLGDFAAARSKLERALALEEQALGADHPDVAWVIGDLASVLTNLGDYAAARPMYERSLAIREAALGPDHPHVATTLAGLAILLDEVGDDAAARSLYERSLAIRERALGPDHPQVANSLDNLAGVLLDLGEYESSRGLFERSLAIREQAFGPDHPDVADSLNNLANLSIHLDDYASARPLYERSLAIREQALGAGHPRVSDSLHNLAVLLSDLGDHAAARAMYERSLDIREQGLGPEHPDVAASLENLASLCSDIGDSAAARPLYQRSIAIRERGLDLLDVLSERESLVYLAANRSGLDRWLAAFVEPGDTPVAWTHALRWKGAVSRRLRARAEAPDEGPEAANLRAEVDTTRRELARLTFAEYDAEQVEARKARLSELTTMKERLERELARSSSAYRAESALADATPHDLCGALPPDTALVDLLRYDAGGPAYLAFVLRSADCTPQRIELGPANPIDEAVASWREALASPSTATLRIDRRGAAVTRLLWDPLAEAVADARHVVVAPDGPLAAVPFAALPLPDGRYLIEERTVAYLDHATDVLRYVEPSIDASGALVVGGVAYGRTSAPAHASDAVADAAYRGLRAAPCVGEAFDALPGTATEADRLTERWRQLRKKSPVLTLTGEAATEAAVAGALQGREVVHIATHAFFATGKCRSMLSGATAATDGEIGVVGYNPMLLSGLVLAGANGPRDPLAAEDGILTAEEVATLPLSGTRLVVLSACETGLGEVKSGDGVLGLRRAFAVSGARSLVMSLWSVPDEATATLMDGLYDGMLRKRRALGAAEALRQAQLGVLAANRSTGEARPQDWAAFVLAGDWR